MSIATVALKTTYDETQEDGTTSAYLGGLVGRCISEGHECIMRNSANYGSVVFSGSAGIANIGGVVGSCESASKGGCALQNVLNCGDTIFSGTTLYDLSMGGVFGMGYHINAEGCVNIGAIITPEGQAGDIGAVIGYADDTSLVAYSYYLDGSYEKGYGDNTLGNVVVEPFNSAFTFGELPSISENPGLGYNSDSDSDSYSYSGSEGSNFDYGEGFTVVDALNNYTAMYSEPVLSKWVLNKRQAPVSFRVNGNLLGTFRSEVILLPSLEREGFFAFEGWYADMSLEMPLIDSRIRTKNNVTLYGRWNESNVMGTVFFETNDGSTISPITVRAGTVIGLPKNVTKQGYSFIKWVDSLGFTAEEKFAVSSQNTTLYALWAITTISSAEEFVEFAGNVNDRGMRYDGLTVILSDDIDMNTVSDFKPVGTGHMVSFDGTFDGQGYTLKNLNINTQNGYVEMFGVSIHGAAIRNVILDRSCSIKAQNSNCAAGIIGVCDAVDRPCKVENSINMAKLDAESDSFENSFYIGGIAAELASYECSASVKNCVNYGSITVTGSAKEVCVSGVIMGIPAIGTAPVSVTNCANFGAISTYVVYESFQIVGGIVVYPSGTISNCVNLGKIEYQQEEDSFMGAITGKEDSGATFENCFWDTTATLGMNWSSGAVESGNNSQTNNVVGFSSYTLSKEVISGEYRGKSLVDVLNAYKNKHFTLELSKWARNTNNRQIKFAINGVVRTSFNSGLIMFLSLANYPNSERMYFDGWYADAAATQPISSYIFKNAATVYGLWEQNNNTYTVSFDVRDGEPMAPISGYYGMPVDLKEPNATE